MTTDQVISISLDGLMVAMKVAMPLLLVGLILGLVVSIFQAVTQIQEQTLSFIPKVVGIALVLVVGGPWMLNMLIGYTERLYGAIPSLVGG